MDEFRAEMQRTAGLSAAAATLQATNEFPQADKSLFARAHEFDSPEAFRVAVEASHRERAALIQQGREAALKEAGLEPSAPSPPPTDSGSTLPAGGAMPSKEQLAAMSPTEFAEFEDKHGEQTVDAILRS